MYPFIKLTKNKLYAILRKYKNKKIFIVHGKKSYELSGAKNIFSVIFSSLNCIIQEHYDFQENPKWEEILPVIQEFKSFNPDLIIAVGGGSVIDTAKLIRFFSRNEGSPESYNKYTAKKLIPFLVFPTTSGTGSESTHFAVCYVKGEKYSVASQTILPDKVYIDYRLTINNPAYLTACTGMDALSQAIESYWSVKSITKSMRYARRAIKLLYPNLHSCVHKPCNKVRMKISHGSYWAGKAINITKTTAPHAFSYKITSLLNLPHGHAVATSLPYFIKKNMNINKNNCINELKYAQITKNIKHLSRLLDLEKNSISNFITNTFSGLYVKNVPNEEQWKTILNGVNIQRLLNNPVKIDIMPTINDFLW